jgi:peptide chain release factor subunit 1
MARLSHDAVRSLASKTGGSAPVVSLYLDVDGRRYVRPKDYEGELDRMLRQARERANGNGAMVAKEFERIDAHVRGGLDRSHTRGVAIFACAQAGLWEVLDLPVPVRNQLVVNQHPQVRQLEAILDVYERFGVLLVDKQRARMLVFELGELVDKSELFDQLPRHDDDHGDWEKDHVRNHAAVAAHQHVRRAAQVAFHVHQEKPLAHLILSTPAALVHEVERELHPYLRERIAARLTVPANASDDVIRTAAMKVEDDIERAKEASVVSRLRDGLPHGRAVAGIDATLAALAERRVDTLVVSDGFEAPGWRCTACGAMLTLGPSCKVCRTGMEKCDDIVEEAIDEALAQAARVAVCRVDPDLDVLGRIGGLVRF